MPHHADSDLRHCIDQCTRCHDVCLRTATTHCLSLGGEHAKPAHLTLMLDCAQICQTAADFMLRGSPRHREICSACAEICDTCAMDCERVGDMDECVAACRACATSCHDMASAMRR